MTRKCFRISQIEPQKKNKNRVNVYLDGKFGFGLSREVLLKYPLHEGDTIHEDLIRDVLISEEKAIAKGKALRFLSYRARSVAEVRKKLNQGGFTEQVIEPIIEDFLRVGLLNDEHFASLYVESRMSQKPMGRRLLKQELLFKGIQEDIVEHAIESGYRELRDEEIARNLIRKRIMQYQNMESLKKKKKLTDFLQRRGFDWEVINTVIRELHLEE